MALPPKTKGELGKVANPRNIRSEMRARPEPEIQFSWGPLSVPFTMTIQSTTYPYQEDEPVEGAPDQGIIRLTSAYTELTFTADVRVPEGDTIVEYEWDFGDGTKAHGPVARHTYTTGSPSTRAVLCVTDNHGRRFCRGRQMNLRPAQLTIVGMGPNIEAA